MKNMQLKGKLTLTMLCVGLLPLLVSLIIIEQLAANALEARAFEQLKSLRVNKEKQIENYFVQIQDQIKTFSTNLMVIEASKQFRSGFLNTNQLDDATYQMYRDKLADYYRNDFATKFKTETGKEIDVEALIPTDHNRLIAQYDYIANNPHPLGEKVNLVSTGEAKAYDLFHRRYHPVFKDYLEKFGYYDIFLVEPYSGNIVYSVFKELDYATSLIDGPYSNTNFARAFVAAKESKQAQVVFTEDFEPYIPSYEAPAAFMSVPVMEGENLIAVLIFQMPVDRINTVMQTSEGLGESGETYLVGKDLLMRSQSRFTEDPTLLHQKVDTSGVRAALTGQSDTSIFPDYRGVPVLSSYSPVKIEGLDWVILAEIDEEEAMQAVAKMQWIGLALAILVSVIVFLVSTRFVKGVIAQLGADPSLINKIALEISRGNLNINLDTADKPVGVLASMVTMRDNLNDQIETDKQKANEIGRIKQSLDKVSSEIMMADLNYNIIYLNEAATKLFKELEADICQELPDFKSSQLLGQNIDIFHQDPSHQRALLNQLKSTYTSDICIGDLHLRVIANPVINDDGERLGTVVEWQNRTQEVLIQQEVSSIVNAAKDGDLSNRITLEGKTGFYGNMSEGVNSLVEIADDVIRDMNSVLSGMSNGDLTVQIDRDYKGAFGELKNNANATVSKLTEILEQIKATSYEVRTTSEEISSGSLDLGVRTDQQASNLEETASSMEEMNASVSNTAQNASEANEQAKQAMEKARNGGEIITDAVNAMSEISEASSKIADIVNVIDEIAFQTNLLALNASVEAARAGEQGRGFAVVADEVRNLSQRTSSSAKEIKDLIMNSLSKVEAGKTHVHTSGEALEEIIHSVEQVSDAIEGIAQACREQSGGISQVNSSIASMDGMTQQNASLVEEATSSSKVMTEKAKNLSQMVDFFKVNH
ncbi:MAG: methyl-accepting chemotaxis protein [Neptuniibacter sp.]